MKEMYVKPMVEKIVFDQDVITQSGIDTPVEIASQSQTDGCTVTGNGKKNFQNKNTGCQKIH